MMHFQQPNSELYSSDDELLLATDSEAGNRTDAHRRSATLSAVRYRACVALIVTAAGVAVLARSGSSAAPEVAGISETVGLSKEINSSLTQLVRINWVGNMERCIGVKGGVSAANKSSHLVLVDCIEESLLFTVPIPDDPFMHVAHKPELCVDNPGKTVLQLWPCNDSKAEANMKFFLKASAKNSTQGSIQPFKNTSRCMDSPRDEYGAPVQMWDCMNSSHELFMLNITSEVIKNKPGTATRLRRSHSHERSKAHEADISRKTKSSTIPTDADSRDLLEEVSTGFQDMVGRARTLFNR